MKNQNKNSKGAVATGVLAALAASSCCIPPVIAAIAGVGGAAGTLSWIEPLRPYLIGLAIVAIGYAWYSHLNPKNVDDCGCDIDKPKWYQTKFFLIGITFFAAISITFPYYSRIFFSYNTKEVVVADDTVIQKITMEIEGMTCEACQYHINSVVENVSGIISVETSYETGKAIIEFDTTKTTVTKIEEAINTTGYKAK